MRPTEFKQANKYLLKPEGLTDEECGTLPVFSNGKEIYSLWKMSWKERFSALFFGNVWLVVHSGETHPPVALLAVFRMFKKVKTGESDD